MTDIKGHIRALEHNLAAVLRQEEAAVAELEATLQHLHGYACAAAEDDLAECAEQGLAWTRELMASDDPPGTMAAEQLSEMVATLVAAYTGDAEGDDEPPAPTAQTGRDEVPVPPAAAPAGDGVGSVAEATSAGTVAPANEHDPPVDRDPEILREFLIESGEHLSEVERHLLVLDTDPEDVSALRALFRGFHTIKGLASFLEFPGVETLAHAAEDVLSVVRDARGPLPAGATDVILEAVDHLTRTLDEIRAAADAGGPMPALRPEDQELARRLRALSGEAGSAPAIPQATARGPGPVVVDEVEDDPEMPSGHPGGEGAAAQELVQGGQLPGHLPVRLRRETLRVDADRLDRLVDMVGELVITESMVTRSVDHITGTIPGLSRHISHMDKITRELHELAGSLRLVPVRGTFRKMARLARDVARKSGKRVHFSVVGEEAELDKTLVDQISDPLVHMVRNAIDHGLEPDVDSRLAVGKSPVGQVVLRALHRGGSVYIEVEDDGRGLDPGRVMRRAIACGLAREGETLSNRDIIRLICEPGFTTADKVTAISGRGVGMDVVRQQIEAMNGSLDVTSEVGKGTCFSMQLPLTLAVIDGMVMRLGRDRYVVPTLSVVRLVKAKDARIATVAGRGEVIKLGDELIPVVRSDEVFGIVPQHSGMPLVVVIDVDGGKVAMVVDELIGQQQVVIKSLGDGLGDIPGLAGCAIMPDGRVGIVLDVGGIVRRHQLERTGQMREAS